MHVFFFRNWDHLLTNCFKEFNQTICIKKQKDIYFIEDMAQIVRTERIPNEKYRKCKIGTSYTK